jgi:hypothetical protein
MRKPFDVLAEGLELSKTRGDWTAIELCVEGVRGWEVLIQRVFIWHPDDERP